MTFRRTLGPWPMIDLDRKGRSGCPVQTGVYACLWVPACFLDGLVDLVGDRY